MENIFSIDNFHVLTPQLLFLNFLFVVHARIFTSFTIKSELSLHTTHPLPHETTLNFYFSEVIFKNKYSDAQSFD